MTSVTAAEARRLLAGGNAPAGLTVDGDLDFYGTAITTLPAGLVVDGTLDLSGTPVSELPDGLRVGGDLELHGTTITTLPPGLTVGGTLYVRGSPVSALPPGLILGGNLRLSASTDFAFPTAWYRTPGSATRWRALASDGQYTLLQSEHGQLRAGCRGPWSRAEALAHWRAPVRTDVRGRLFAAAIERLQPVRGG